MITPRPQHATHPTSAPEPQDWIRVHKGTGHVSRCSRSTVLHRLYVARPELDPASALILMREGGPFETAYAVYRKGVAPPQGE